MFVGENVNIATSSTVASRGRAVWFELLAVKGNATIPASSCIYQCIEPKVKRCTPRTCAHMYNEVVKKSFALRVECKHWIGGNEVVTHPLPSFPLCLSFSEGIVPFFPLF